MSVGVPGTVYIDAASGRHAAEVIRFAALGVFVRCAEILPYRAKVKLLIVDGANTLELFAEVVARGVETIGFRLAGENAESATARVAEWAQLMARGARPIRPAPPTPIEAKLISVPAPATETLPPLAGSTPGEVFAALDPKTLPPLPDGGPTMPPSHPAPSPVPAPQTAPPASHPAPATPAPARTPEPRSISEAFDSQFGLARDEKKPEQGKRPAPSSLIDDLEL